MVLIFLPSDLALKNHSDLCQALTLFLFLPKISFSRGSGRRQNRSHILKKQLHLLSRCLPPHLFISSHYSVCLVFLIFLFLNLSHSHRVIHVMYRGKKKLYFFTFPLLLHISLVNTATILGCCEQWRIERANFFFFSFLSLNGDFGCKFACLFSC